MKYRIDLTNYKVPYERWQIEEKDGKKERVLKKGEEDLIVKDELYSILRIPGVYDDGIQTCDGVDLANQIKKAENYIDIDVKLLELLKKVFNKLIARPHNPAAGQICLGGETYIPLIQRIFKAEEVKE